MNIESREFDENALTVRELAQLRNKSASHMGKICRDKELRGEWEKVYKPTAHGPVPAYRPKKK